MKPFITFEPLLPFSGLTMPTRATSRLAAPGTAEAMTQRRRVLELIRTSPDGMTDDELQVALNMEGNTQRPRRIELYKLGCIEVTSQRRPTRKGRDAVVWQFVKELA